jgi:hypothetical protein
VTQHEGDLAALRAEVAEGWKVKITDHDYLNDSRDDVTVTRVTDNGLVLTPFRPWSSQGRKFVSMIFTWDKEEEGVTGRNDQEVSGRTVHLYHTPPPHTGKSRRLVKTFVFSPPREY